MVLSYLKLKITVKSKIRAQKKLNLKLSFTKEKYLIKFSQFLH